MSNTKPYYQSHFSANEIDEAIGWANDDENGYGSQKTIVIRVDNNSWQDSVDKKQFGTYYCTFSNYDAALPIKVYAKQTVGDSIFMLDNYELSDNALTVYSNLKSTFDIYIVCELSSKVPTSTRFPEYNITYVYAGNDITAKITASGGAPSIYTYKHNTALPYNHTRADTGYDWIPEEGILVDWALDADGINLVGPVYNEAGDPAPTVPYYTEGDITLYAVCRIPVRYYKDNTRIVGMENITTYLYPTDKTVELTNPYNPNINDVFINGWTLQNGAHGLPLVANVDVSQSSISASVYLNYIRPDNITSWTFGTLSHNNMEYYGVVSCSSPQGVCAVPHFHDNQRVEGIGQRAFVGQSITGHNFVSVAISHFIKYIGDYAFVTLSQYNLPVYYGASVDRPSDYWYCGDLSSWCSIVMGNSFLFQTGTDKQTLYINHQPVNGVLELPENISVGAYTFAYYLNLTEVVIPNTTNIGQSTFKHCVNLKNIYGPAEASGLAATACGRETSNYFSAYTRRDNNLSVTITSGSSIPSFGFGGCSWLRNITFPDELTTIGSYAFRGCSTLKTITLPRLVNVIDTAAFEGCTNVETINFEGDLLGWCNIAGVDNLMTYGKNSRKLYVNNSLISGDIILPSGIERLYTRVFARCTDITSVTVQDDVKYIDDNIFEQCMAIQSLVMPSVCTVQDGYYQRSLGALWGSTYKSSGYQKVTQFDPRWNSFVYYYIPAALRSITITKSLSAGALSGCKQLTDINISDITSDIPEYAFYECTVSTISIPNSVTNIGIYAFANCTYLTSINYDGTTAQWGAITKDSSWNQNTGDYTIYCTDGQIAKNGTITIYTEGLAYTLNSDNLSYSCSGIGTATDTDIVIAPVYNDLPVTNVENSAFSNNTTLTSVVVCNGVTILGENAFNGCTNLTSVVIPESIVEISASVFNDCQIESATISTAVISFIPQSHLQTVVITSGESISDNAFSGCNSLISITIPDTVTRIGNMAFNSCSSLTTITIPGSVTSIGDMAFQSCTGLTSITIPNRVASIGKGAFAYCTGLISIVIPNSVTSIGSDAFSGCIGLTSIAIPNSMTSIDEGVFSGCSGLTSISISNSVTSIKNRAFNGCTSLTSITIPNSVVSIGNMVFQSCTNLISILYNSTIAQWGAILLGDGWDTGTGSYTIYCTDGEILKDGTITRYTEGLTYRRNSGRQSYSCSGIGTATDTDIVIASIYNGLPVVSIESGAFYDCSTLTSIAIPNSVTSIGEDAFYGCTSLQYNEYDNAHYLGNRTNPYVALISRKSADIINCTINNNCKVIYGNAFNGCASLISITVPDGMASIGKNAFYGCTSLTSIVIPDSVATLPGGLFSGCSSLTSMTIPFVGGSATATSASRSTLFGYIFGTSSYTGGTSTKQYYTSSSSATYYIPSTLRNVTVTGGNILYGAFYNCSMLTSVTIGNGVTSIGQDAFYGCTGLTSITIPGSVTSIGNGAFYGCSMLTSVSIPDSVTSIGEYAFYKCSGLKSIIIPDSVTSIGYGAFEYCRGLTSITIPDSVTSIGSSAFSGCSSLVSMTIPFVGGSATTTSANSSTLFGYIFGTGTYTGGTLTRQYYASTSYSTYYIPSSLRNVTVTGGNILYGAFYNCSMLTSVSIPDNVTSIGSSTFENCIDLTSIVYNGTIAQWGVISLGSNWNRNTGNYTIHCTDGDIPKA